MAFNVSQPFQNLIQNQTPNPLDVQMPFQQPNINPQGFTNQNNINGIYGQANQGTFTRTVQSPFMQNANTSIDPIDYNTQADAENVMAATGFATQPLTSNYNI
jgi:hypothetical protein